MRFFKCEHCGNIITFVEDKGVPVLCCGEKMKEIVAGTVDAAKEKHIPVVKVEGNKVKVIVGEIAHPMTEEHSITWAAIETNEGCQLKKFSGEKPEIEFALNDGEEVKEVYAYCNLHGLWKA